MTNNKILTPVKIVHELDKHIIGQFEAKRAVAIALRSRWRRLHVNKDLKSEIKPKNILLIGPTGVGKTEIARRLSCIVNAPFIKVEATKFTEVGYVGRDVESIIRDLIESAIKKTREEEIFKVKRKAYTIAIERVLAVLLDTLVEKNCDTKNVEENNFENTKKILREKLKNGEFDNKVVDIEISVPNIGIEIMAPPGMEEMTNQLQNMFSNINTNRKKKRKIKVKNAIKYLCDEEIEFLINEDENKQISVEKVEQHGIVFIDEIDKITQRGRENYGEISREGVQRDLLPLVEGTTVSTKYGIINTEHILFIASGAFHLSKPSDLIPELQGRFPIRVELNALCINDFIKILTEPKASLVQQYKALLEIEDIHLDFTEDGIKRIAEIAFYINEKNENIGARRLYTIMERLLENISYEMVKKSFIINNEYVNNQLEIFLKNEDITKYIL